MSRKSDYQTFVENFKPIDKENEESFLWETYTPDVTEVSRIAREKGEQFIWTLVEGERKLYLIPGVHYVNRLNYVICENPWEEGQRDYLY